MKSGRLPEKAGSVMGHRAPEAIEVIRRHFLPFVAYKEKDTVFLYRPAGPPQGINEWKLLNICRQEENAIGKKGEREREGGGKRN